MTQRVPPAPEFLQLEGKPVGSRVDPPRGNLMKRAVARQAKGVIGDYARSLVDSRPRRRNVIKGEIDENPTRWKLAMAFAREASNTL